VPVSRLRPAVASSELPRSNAATYAAANVIDGSQSTAWVEGVPGLGAGQWIAIYLGDVAQLRGLKQVSGIIYGGYEKSALTFQNNSRPSLLNLEVLVDSQPIGVASVSFDDAIVLESEIAAEFGIPVTSYPAQGTLWLRTTIARAQAGKKWEDTGISEIRYNLASSNPHGVREALMPFARAVNAKSPTEVSAFTTIPPQRVLNAFTNEDSGETRCGLEEMRVITDAVVEVPARYGENGNYFARFVYDGFRWRLKDFSRWGFEWAETE